MMDPAQIVQTHPWIVSCRVLPVSGAIPDGAREFRLRGGLIWADQIIDAQYGRCIVLQCLRCSLPLEYARVTIELVPKTARDSMLRLRLEYRPRFGLVGEIVEVMGLKHLLQQALQQWSQGIAHLDPPLTSLSSLAHG